jgi:hypothetical protein
MTALNLAVAAQGDDGYASLDGTSDYSATATSLIVGAPAHPQRYGAWMRFLNVTIPAGSTIDTAVLSIEAVSLFGTLANIRTKVFADDIDTAVAPTTRAEFTALVRTTAGVDWDPAEWVADTIYTAPDLAAVIQEVIDRPGWASGNALQLLWDDDGTTSSARVSGASFDHATFQEPRLVINYTAASGGIPLFMNHYRQLRRRASQ